ncbi:MAG: DUF2924 domain-containing protein [Alphaproteobacteria bacterium]|nr:DUF2924 domain-containing protein [Alphaproteobacteria bacterium]
MTSPILKQIAELHDAPQDKLKELWREYFCSEPPAYRRGFLIRGLAHRIQELTYGGLDPLHQRRFDALVAEKPKARKAEPVARDLLPGTRLVRTWQGVAHEVNVLSDGLEYQGRRFRSLSAVAREITGTRWNGWIFFGLANPNKKERTA